jgi:hypothetical protein
LILYISRPSKTDSVPVRGDGYEPRSSKFRPRANAETSHSVRYDMVVVVASSMGGGKRFSHGIVRSRKPPLLVPPYDSSYYTTILLSKIPIRSNIDIQYLIASLDPQ